MEFFTEYGEASQYQIEEIIGKGSFGVVAAAVDTQTGERVAIKKIHDMFEHASNGTRILREIKLLRLLRHPNIVETKHILLPPARREFRDIYVVFELMESDLQKVIQANENLTAGHHRFFLYQLLHALKYIHAANVFHRDLKPSNILVNSNCKLKICDFGLARASRDDPPLAIFWTDYVATRWYRAPELCGSFFSKYTPAIDIWSIGCIFAEVLTRKPLFPGTNVKHQLDLITDVLGTPSYETLSQIRNEKARIYLTGMKRKHPIPFPSMFCNADPQAVRLLERLLAFDPKDRPTAEEALADPYFEGFPNLEHEPSPHPFSKLEFEFERWKLTKDGIRDLIYREERVCAPKGSDNQDCNNERRRTASSAAQTTIRSQQEGLTHAYVYQNGTSIPNFCSGYYLQNGSTSASSCVIDEHEGLEWEQVNESVARRLIFAGCPKSNDLKTGTSGITAEGEWGAGLTSPQG
ncbi:Mitogen-activated protein kinase 13 [Triticum urartu]|uniref:Mitogen-activated protein kinase n=1 Tax=Triticum urartu TaxID=4572 RepID=M8AZG8_TRIUA|nr:Mitogen-activated protein kinase 13 [Triticum urartu]